MSFAFERAVKCDPIKRTSLASRNAVFTAIFRIKYPKSIKNIYLITRLRENLFGYELQSIEWDEPEKMENVSSKIKT